ncbi:MAG TPA: peptidoglycan-binding domain-containing protein, partial [Polyangiaceae bacterium]|nr:peptidoglycan-binding domain-containing protein [Polyangiaceae bacterium]
PSAASASAAASHDASGMNRMQVEQMQRELAQRGLYRGAIDGMAGPQTMAALRQFQEQQGLPSEGGFDDATRQALGIQSERQPVSGTQTSASPELERPVGREGTTPAVTGNRPMRSQVQLDTLNQEQITTLQTRLREFGFYQGQVDGVIGEGTRSALRQFYQTQADLASRGIITDATVGVFGVSPQGLNGTPPATSSQRGTQPRGTDTRGTMNPMGTHPTGTSPGTNSATGTLRNNNGIDEMNSAPPSGSTNAPTRSTPPAPSGQSGTTPR